MKKKYYRIRTHFDLNFNGINLDGSTKSFSLPDGIIGVCPVFSNKKKALRFLKLQKLPNILLEEISLTYIDRLTGLEK